MVKSKKEKEETAEGEPSEELEEDSEENLTEEEKEKLRKLRREELEELFASKSRGINPTNLGKFLSSKTQVALEKRDVVPQANLEKELEEVPIKKEEEKKITYELYSPNNSSKYAGEPEAFSYKNPNEIMKKIEENKLKSEIEIMRADEKRFTKQNFGSTTFGANEKSRLDDLYTFREPKDPKKEYKPNIKIN